MKMSIASNYKYNDILNKCDGVSDRAIYTDAIASKKTLYQID